MKKQKGSTDLYNTDSELYQRMKRHLLSGKSVLGQDSPFSELLQDMVNAIMEGEMDGHLREQKQIGQTNKRNGYQKPRQVITDKGSISITKPRGEPQFIV
ncbi:MAG: transposase [Bacteroidota bacterium]